MKILIGVPSYTGNIHPECQKSIAALGMLLKERGHELLMPLKTRTILQAARNYIVRETRLKKAVKLLWVDDDVSFNAEDALRLIESPQAVCAGAVRLKTEPETYVLAIDTKDDIALGKIENGVVRISASRIGMAFTCMTLDAIEKFCAAYPEKQHSISINGSVEYGFHDLFSQGVYEGAFLGEDMAFCYHWSKIGGKVWIYPDMTLTHWDGDNPYVGNYDQFLRRQPKEQVVKASVSTPGQIGKLNIVELLSCR